MIICKKIKGGYVMKRISFILLCILMIFGVMNVQAEGSDQVYKLRIKIIGINGRSLNHMEVVGNIKSETSFYSFAKRRSIGSIPNNMVADVRRGYIDVTFDGMPENYEYFLTGDQGDYMFQLRGSVNKADFTNGKQTLTLKISDLTKSKIQVNIPGEDKKISVDYIFIPEGVTRFTNPEEAVIIRGTTKNTSTKTIYHTSGNYDVVFDYIAGGTHYLYRKNKMNLSSSQEMKLDLKDSDFRDATVTLSELFSGVRRYKIIFDDEPLYDVQFRSSVTDKKIPMFFGGDITSVSIELDKVIDSNLSIIPILKQVTKPIKTGNSLRIGDLSFNSYMKEVSVSVVVEDDNGNEYAFYSEEGKEIIFNMKLIQDYGVASQQYQIINGYNNLGEPNLLPGTCKVIIETVGEVSGFGEKSIFTVRVHKEVRDYNLRVLNRSYNK